MEADDCQVTTVFSPTVIPPLALDRPSIMKRYHRRRTTKWGVTARSPTMVTFHDTRFVECRWLNDGWTVKTVVTWRSLASMIPAPDVLFLWGSQAWFLPEQQDCRVSCTRTCKSRSRYFEILAWLFAEVENKKKQKKHGSLTGIVEPRVGKTCTGLWKWGTIHIQVPASANDGIVALGKVLSPVCLQSPYDCPRSGTNVGLVELRSFPTSDRLVGLVVEASASRAEDPGFESRLRRDFFGVESYQWLKNWHSSGYPARSLAL